MSTTNTHTQRERRKRAHTLTYTDTLTPTHTQDIPCTSALCVRSAPLTAIPRSDVIELHPEHEGCSTLWVCAWLTAFTGPRCVGDATMTLTLPGISYIYDTTVNEMSPMPAQQLAHIYVDCLAALQICSVTISPCTATPVLCESGVGWAIHDLATSCPCPRN